MPVLRLEIYLLTVCIYAFSHGKSVNKFQCHRRNYKCTLRDSAQDGLGHGAAVSPITACSLRWKRISTQSMIHMMRWGGRSSFLTVAINTHQNSEVIYLGTQYIQSTSSIHYGCLSSLSTTPESFIHVVVHLLFSSETSIVCNILTECRLY